MERVKRVRVCTNITVMLALSALLLWASRTYLVAQPVALATGCGLGGLAGWWRWWHLRGRIARRDRRYARNRLFVDYLHLGEVVLTALVYNPVVAAPVLVGVAAVVWLAPMPLVWWLVCTASAAGAGMSVLLAVVVAYEYRHGPLYYQCDSSNWSGAEGLLYQCGTVCESLQPAGKVTLPGGILWNAVSVSGEAIPLGEAVEVIAVQGLTLHVDRLPALSGITSATDIVDIT